MHPDRRVFRQRCFHGGLKVRRRAADLYQRLIREHGPAAQVDPLAAMDWVTLWALAVNEENASGGGVVTAPTNGAAGIIPGRAALRGDVRARHRRRRDRATSCSSPALSAPSTSRTASISGAEVGCQGEVGVGMLDGGRRAGRDPRRHA